MRDRTIMLMIAILAALLWVGLAVFMLQRPPDVTGQTFFLIIFWGAISSTGVPVSYFANGRWGVPMGPRGDIQRAVRQGVLVAVVATILMALRFMRSLTLATALVFLLVAMLIEVMLALRGNR